MPPVGSNCTAGRARNKLSHVLRMHPSRLITVVQTRPLCLGPAQAHSSGLNRDGEVDGVTICCAVDHQAAEDLPFKSRLLEELPETGLLRRFAPLDTAAGQNQVAPSVLLPRDDEEVAVIAYHRDCTNSHSPTL